MSHSYKNGKISLEKTTFTKLGLVVNEMYSVAFLCNTVWQRNAEHMNTVNKIVVEVACITSEGN